MNWTIFEGVHVSEVEHLLDDMFGINTTPMETWTIHFCDIDGEYSFVEVERILN